MSVNTDLSLHEDNEDDEEIILVSKSELKRDAADLKKLGEKLVNLSLHVREKLPLDEDLQAAIALAAQLKKEGKRRQLQLIGKLLRQRDVQPLRQALEKLENRHNQQTVQFHKLQNLRDKLISTGDSAISEVLEYWPQAERQHLRMLIRNAQKEQSSGKSPKSSRLIFQYLRQLQEHSTQG